MLVQLKHLQAKRPQLGEADELVLTWGHLRPIKAASLVLLGLFTQILGS